MPTSSLICQLELRLTDDSWDKPVRLCLQLAYLPTAIVGFLTLLFPPFDVLFYICFLISFMISLVLALGIIGRRRILPALLGGVAVPIAAFCEGVVQVVHYEDLPLVLCIAVGVSIQTFLTARAENAAMTPVFMLVPFFNALGISAIYRTPRGISPAQVAIVAAVVALSALLAAAVFPLPRNAAENLDDTL